MARLLFWPVSKVELSAEEEQRLDGEREAFAIRAHEAGVPIYPRAKWRLLPGGRLVWWRGMRG